MQNKAKNKSFLYSVSLIGIIFLILGVVFIAVAVTMQLVPISPDSMNVTYNGVRQPSTAETVRGFRLIFLLAFGAFGLVMTVTGALVAIRFKVKHKAGLRLKDDGRRVTAVVTDYTASNVSVNNRRLMRLNCAYTAPDGRVYIFKSGLLRMNPAPYLNQGQVTVYHDRDDMSRYFVDVDGSVGIGTRVFEM